MFKTRADKANFIAQLVLLVVVLAWTLNFRMEVREVRRRIDELGRRLDHIRQERERIERQMDEVQRWQQQHDCPRT